MNACINWEFPPYMFVVVTSDLTLIYTRISLYNGPVGFSQFSQNTGFSYKIFIIDWSYDRIE